MSHNEEIEEKEESRIPIWVYVAAGALMIALAFIGSKLSGDDVDGAASVSWDTTSTVTSVQ